MTIEELNTRIGLAICEIDDISIATNECKNISIEFAISVLNDIILNYNKPLIDLKYGLDKIQELKEYLDEI